MEAYSAFTITCTATLPTLLDVKDSLPIPLFFRSFRLEASYVDTLAPSGASRTMYLMSAFVNSLPRATLVPVLSTTFHSSLLFTFVSAALSTKAIATAPSATVKSFVATKSYYSDTAVTVIVAPTYFSSSFATSWNSWLPTTDSTA